MRAVRSLTAVIALALVACSHVDPYLATGDIIKATGQEFVIVAGAMNQAAMEHTITVDQYQRWAEFVARFKPAYALAVKSYKLALTEKDRRSAITVVQDLSMELATFTPLVVQLVKGAP